MNEEERAWLEALAVDAGISASDILRMFIRDSYRTKFGTKKPKARKAVQS